MLLTGPISSIKELQIYFWALIPISVTGLTKSSSAIQSQALTQLPPRLRGNCLTTYRIQIEMVRSLARFRFVAFLLSLEACVQCVFAQNDSVSRIESIVVIGRPLGNS